MRLPSKELIPKGDDSHAVVPFVIAEKSKSPLRWPVLVLACLMLIGSYYCYDIPSSLKTQIDDYMGDPSQYETYFALLYTLYSVPNVMLPFFGGYFVDTLGVGTCLMLFTSLIAVGQVVVCLGFSIKSWPIIFLGRFVFALGGENLIVANSALLADWFKGRELAFSFGINLSIARVGSVVNNVVSPSLTQSTGIIFAMWFGAILCAGSVFSVVATLPIDKHLNDKIRDGKIKLASFTSLNVLNDEALGSDSSMSASLNSSTSSKAPTPQADTDSAKKPPAISIRDIVTLPHIFWVLVLICVVVYGCVLPFNNVASSLLLERNYFIIPPADCHLPQYGCQSSSNVPQDCPSNPFYQPPLPYNVTVDDIYYQKVQEENIDCSLDSWSASASGCTSEYCSRLGAGEAQAALVMSIPYIISGVMSPVIGFFIDKYGYRAVIATGAAGLLIIVHLLLGYSTVSPVGPLVGQGLAYTGFAAVLWPAIPLVVEDRLTGLAFGIVTSALNSGTAVLPLIVAAIYSCSDSLYIPNVELLFSCLGCFGFGLGIYLNFYDMQNQNVLNRGEVPDDSYSVLQDASPAEEESWQRATGAGSSYDAKLKV